MTEGTPQEPDPHFDGFIDGRVDEEKVAELLTFSEGTHLEFKSTLDLDRKEGKVKFAKDVVAMSNTPPGGYILVGVDDDGKPCAEIGHFDRALYDSAQLGDILRSYADGRVELRVRITEYGDNEIVVIFVHPHADGLPVPMGKPGTFPDLNDPKRQVTLFKQGEVPVREGAANVPLRHVHWTRILAEFIRRTRAEGTEIAQELLRAFVEQRAHDHSDEFPPSRSELPLLIDMDEDTFSGAVQQALEAERGDVRIRRFLSKVMKSVNSKIDDDKFCTALDKWTVLCAEALYAERSDIVLTAVTMLREEYGQLWIDARDDSRRLDVVVRLYAVGSMAIRMSAWSVVHGLALRAVPSNAVDSTYTYSSWIRHAQVQASRANLIPNNRGGFLISAARELLLEHPAMRPEVGDDEIPSFDELAPDDVLINSLAQFDLAYCFVVAAEGRDHGGYYPSSAALKDHRAAPIAVRIASQPEVRRNLFPSSTDSQVAAAMADVYRAAEQEAANYRQWWDMPKAVVNFVQQHGTLAD